MFPHGLKHFLQQIGPIDNNQDKYGEQAEGATRKEDFGDERSFPVRGLKRPDFGRGVGRFQDVGRDKEPDCPQGGGAEDEEVKRFDGRL